MCVRDRMNFNASNTFVITGLDETVKGDGDLGEGKELMARRSRQKLRFGIGR